MKIAIVDDMKNEADNLTRILLDYSEDNRIDVSVTYFQNAERLLSFSGSSLFDIIFMDIYMDGMTGIQAVEKMGLRAKSELPYIIIMTLSPEHMSEAFHLHVYDYLIKPLNKDDVFKVMEDITQALTREKEQSDELVFIYEKIEYHILFDNITAIKSEGHYLEINTLQGEMYKTRMTFSEARDHLLKDRRFLMVLRGILVNMDYIQSIKDGRCNLENGSVIPANIKNCKQLEQIWNNYMFEKIKNENLGRLADHDT